MDLLRLYSNFQTLSVWALQSLKIYFLGRGASIFQLGYEYLRIGVQDFLVLMCNPVVESVLIYFLLFFRYINLYSNQPEIPFETTNTRELRGKKLEQIDVLLLQSREKFHSVSNISFFLS